MPGTTLLLVADPSRLSASAFAAAQDVMLHQDDYRAVRETSELLAWGHVGYPGYPARVVTREPCVVLLEGRVYNLAADEIERELQRLADAFVAARGPDELAGAVEAWIRRAEGEFVVSLLDPARQRVAVFSDSLGRLPLYWHADAGRLLVAREAKFLLAMTPGLAFDRLGWAQTLWLNYPLGERTLLEGVRRAPGGCLLWGNVAAGRVEASVRTLFTYDFGAKRECASLPAEARRLAELLVDGCRRRGLHPDASVNVVSLSGGQDSRAVAAGFWRAGVPFVTASYVTETDRSRRDAALARQVAEAMRVQWHRFEVPGGDESAAAELAWLRDGLNYAAMAFILAYCRGLVRTWGRGAVYVSGDGGDKVLPDLRAAPRLRSTDELIATLIRQHATCPASEAAALVGIDARALGDSLREVVETYPETDPVQRSVHYVVYERGRKWLYEGEDRTRGFLWQTSPFYDTAFFSACMSLPDDIKTDYRFYRHVQNALSRELASLPDAGLGLASSSPFYVPKRWLVRTVVGLPPAVREPLRALVKGPRAVPKPTTSPFSAPVVREAAASCAGVFDRARLATLLAHGSPVPLTQVATLALLLEQYRAHQLI